MCFYDTRYIRRHAPSPHLPHDVCTDDDNNNNNNNARSHRRIDATRRAGASPPHVGPNAPKRDEALPPPLLTFARRV